MTAIQKNLSGNVISMDSQQLANLLAFSHDQDEQKKLTVDQISKSLQMIMLGQ